MALAISIEQAQIASAQRLHQRLGQWQLIETALASLAKQFPGFAQNETLLKATAVNALYSTNVLAIHHVVMHLVVVLQQANLSSSGPELVENLAVPPPIEGKIHRHHSFASKFAHFFICAERFPIKDSYVVEMMKFHLGRKHAYTDAQSPYLAFYGNHSLLKEELGFAVSNRELDHYLWLAGLFLAFRKNPKAEINQEVRTLFESSDSSIVSDLATLFPYASNGLLKER